jgi:LuxR family transcriptional regulator, maltose regulon positive regulatory protein
MSYPILPTKLYIPTTRSDLVMRPRLFQKLDEGLKPGFRLMLVSAPAGFGKSTLVSEWARQIGLPTAWLTCDESDNDPIRFWNYFLAAIQTVDPELGKRLAALVQASPPPPIDVLITALVNEIASFTKPFCIILDDYHHIEDKTIHKNIDFLLDYLPSVVHLIIVTRVDPPLHLARRRGRSELCEIRAADLRFTKSEITDLLNQIMRLNLDQRDLNALEARTEGWIVGLQLAALSLQGRSDAHAFISAFEGDDRFIADYLVEEVLNRQPEHIRDFLQDTSVLHRMNGALCDALTSGHNSQAILNALENANLFILPLDNRREWFRYHQLFAKLLRQYLIQKKGIQSMAALYHRSMDWHVQNGLIGDAVEYALEGGEFDTALSLMSQIIGDIFMRNEFATTLRWAELIPESLLVQSPGLCLGFGWAAIATSQPKKADYFIQLVEKNVGISVDQFIAMEAAEQQALPADIIGALIESTVQQARVAIDENETAPIIENYSRILPYLTEERSADPSMFSPPFYLRGPMILIIALANELQGNLREAESGYREAVQLGKQLNNHPFVAQGLTRLGQVKTLQGYLNLAEETFNEAMDYSIRQFGQVTGFFGNSMICNGNLAYERNHLHEAQRLLDGGLKLTTLLNDWQGLLPGLTGRAKLRMAEGDSAGAFEDSDELIELSHNFPEIVRTIAEGLRAQLLIHQNRFEEVESWVRSRGYSIKTDPATLPVEHALVLARFWYAQKQFEHAHRFLIELQKDAEKCEEWGRWIEILALDALALDARGLHAEALITLQKSLRRAESESYVRTFVDLGFPMQTLLSQARKSKDFDELHEYLDQLLEAFGSHQDELVETPAAPLFRQPLSEALSDREIEVLGLMATGASNAEIAQEFVITVNTVKKHISNIFSKLGVTTRIQAIERARKLGIIPK